MATNRTALVTGGARGLGAACAERLRADGLTVTTLDLQGADVAADVTDEAALRRVAGEIGPVDVLINSAGVIGPNKPLVETTAGRNYSDAEYSAWMRHAGLTDIHTVRFDAPGANGAVIGSKP